MSAAVWAEHYDPHQRLGTVRIPGTQNDPAPDPFEGRRQVTVDSSEIRPGDWMTDCGRLRLVVSVEATGDPVSPGALVRFADIVDQEHASLTVPGAVKVTVWRTPGDVSGPARV